MRRGKKRNKEHYAPVTDAELDLHGCTSLEARREVEEFIEEAQREGWSRIRIIVGKGTRSPGGIAVLPTTVKSILTERGLSYTYAKLENGGEGALEITL